MKRVLITGAGGYIGSNLSRRLVYEKNEVHALILPDADSEYLADIKNRVTFHIYDGSTESLSDALKISRPDVVFHLASLFLSEHKSEDIINLVSSNVLLGTQLLESMCDNNIRNFINTGTSWQHYQNQDYNPVNLYAATKQAFEDILKFYTESDRIRAITLQLFDTYGPGDRRHKLFKLFRDAYDRGETLNMSPGEQLIDLMHVDDVVNAFIAASSLLLSDVKIKNNVYALSSRKPLSLKDIAEIYKKSTGRQININWGGRPYRRREVYIPWDSGEVLPGWLPEKDLYKSLSEL